MWTSTRAVVPITKAQPREPLPIESAILRSVGWRAVGVGLWLMPGEEEQHAMYQSQL